MYPLVCCCFFFFKQKTAYEMRISDWSSDVCSSDLLSHRLPRRFRLHGAGVLPRPPRLPDEDAAAGRGSRGQRQARGVQRPPADDPSGPHRAPVGSREPADGGAGRSEEHTSELQSLMRISYAVFCLKKKITQIRHYYICPTTTDNHNNTRFSSHHV